MATHGYGPGGFYTAPTTLASWDSNSPPVPAIERYRTNRVYALGMSIIPQYPFKEKDVLQIQDNRG